jgi:hypothetical protein
MEIINNFLKNDSFKEDSLKTMDDFDASMFLLERNEIYSQLNTINRVFALVKEDENNIKSSIKKAEEAIKSNNITFVDDMQRWFYENDLIDQYYLSTYYSISHSSIYTVVLAPTFESIFDDFFRSVSIKYGDSILEKNSERNNLNRKQKWDCHIYVENGKGKKDLLNGIRQLIKDTKFYLVFPLENIDKLELLFFYRNKAFHNGFNWPQNEIRLFTKKIDEGKWERNWYSVTTSNNEPTSYYLTELYAQKCRELMMELINSIGKYYKANSMT